MIKILVADPLDKEGLRKFEEVPGVQAEVRTGLKEDDLAAAVGDYDGMIVRSGAKVTAKVLANPGKLRAIARAGVGVDNIDLAAATKAGVLVMNTPDANTLSTAEHAMALMLALSRHVPTADAHVRERKWKRGDYTGTQLAGKTLGIIGLGRVGTAVAQRSLSFGMKVIAYDPFYSGETAVDGKVKLVKSRDDIFAQADYLSLHTHLSEDTRGMINRENIAKMKDGVRIINCSRGAVINDADLTEALASGKVAGAAVDVYATEPPVQDNPLLSAPHTVLTPHLGASTEEAQLAVTLDAVDALLNYLVKDEIRWAVNVTGLPGQLSPRDKAYLDLARRMGILMSHLGGGVIESVKTTTHGEALEALSGTLQKQFLVDMLNPCFEKRLNLINVNEFVKQRGIRLEQSADLSSDSQTDRVTVCIQTRDGAHAISGEISVDGLPHIMAISGYPMNLIPAGDMIVIFNHDEPGVIGLVGTIFGNHQVNIADMTLSRQKDTALMVLKLDEPIPQAVIEELQARKPVIRKVVPVTLPPINQA
ncbi:MAG TPA: phosphoglycerate dehydrogenase [Phycisphaerae bacterium]|nr:phosphoglycerate dehydrogenase [Phycisphaerae bacterium]